MGNSASHAHESLDKGFTRSTLGDVKNTAAASFRFSKRSPKKMDRLRRSFRDSFRRRKDRVPESSKPHQWQADDQAVRSATCSFPVKYLGCVEVFESRGMQVCEEALKVLRNSRRRAIRGLLHVSGDGLRVVDDETKGLIVDQTIEKVSFCAPDRNHERGFSYICRDGTTRRWMCHGFLASKDSGERLSHAVGCAFAVCLERKQRRDTECGVTMTFDMKNSTFTRSGSFRTQTMTERLQQQNGNGFMERGVDIGGGPNAGIVPPSAIVAPLPKPHNPFAIERPHVTPSMLERLERQGSFRAVSNQSPFKRQMSLRLNDLPSNAERQKSFLDPQKLRSVSPIPEVSPHKPTDTVAQLCAELSQGLTLLSARTDADANDDLNYNNAMSVNQNTVSLIHSPISPVVSVFPTFPAHNAGLVTSSNSPSAATTPTGQVLPYRYVPPTNVSLVKSPVTPVSPLKPVASPLDKPASAAGDLPMPDQWLAGQIGQSKAPSPGRSTVAPSTVYARTKSLNTSGASASDPFDAEWVAEVAAVAAPANGAPSTHHTNPFISPPKPPAQSFQVQL